MSDELTRVVFCSTTHPGPVLVLSILATKGSDIRNCSWKAMAFGLLEDTQIVAPTAFGETVAVKVGLARTALLLLAWSVRNAERILSDQFVVTLALNRGTALLAGGRFRFSRISTGVSNSNWAPAESSVMSSLRGAITAHPHSAGPAGSGRSPSLVGKPRPTGADPGQTGRDTFPHRTGARGPFRATSRPPSIRCRARLSALDHG